MDKFIMTDEVILEDGVGISDLIRDCVAEATRNGIKANSIVINKNMVRVPEMFGQWPAMICGLHCYITDDELPNGYTFSVQHDCREDATPKWIPVTERLPDRNSKVLVCDNREDYVSIWERFADDLWYGDDIIWATEDITHWMPLPEPPKEV